MERDVQTEREMPRDISYYRERATQYNQVLFETSVVLNGGVPSKDVWSVADLPRMVERVVQRAEAAESRIRELEIANASLPGLLKALNYAVISLETCLDYVDTRQIQGAIDAYKVVIAKANGDGNGEDGNE